MKNQIAVIPVIILALAFQAPSVFAQTTTNPFLQLNAINPQASSSSRPTPTPPTPHTPLPTGACPAFNSAYGGTLQNGVLVTKQIYAFVYPQLTSIDADKPGLIAQLHQNDNFSNLTKENIIQSLTEINEILQGTKVDQQVVDSIKQTGNSPSYSDTEEASFLFYRTLFKLLEDSLKSQYLFTDFYSIAGVLHKNNLPVIPYVAINPGFDEAVPDPFNQPFGKKYGYPRPPTAIFAGYPLAPAESAALNTLGCAGVIPTKVSSGSPQIYVYSSTPLTVRIALPPTTSFMSPAGSFLGWTVTADSLSSPKLYYEYDRSNLKFNLPGSSFIAAYSTWPALVQNIALQLGLNAEETQGLMGEVREALNVKTVTAFLKISLLDQQQVNQVLLLDITPRPTQIYRIHLILTPLNAAEVANPPQLTKLKRGEFTVVEIGAI